MPLCNRVTPFGEIAALPGRGTLTGNRGILIDEQRRIVHQWQTKRWIACRLSYKGIRRKVMQPHAWTELFFLDEAAAFSAGHRPCAECRRDDYRRFRDLWERQVASPASADAMDAVLHRERVDGRKKCTYRDEAASLPDGTYVTIDGAAWLILGTNVYAWSDGGYTSRRARPSGEIDVLTPRSIVTVLRAGYRPAIHPSASGPATLR
ncbi:MAG TPA: hypothetical protein VFE36_16525 [Candidatus Baltobacteraceae bacterium]|jgi:hypothetical protein|nr:hypothetical protein [Candidatus Baltobacteraceae bacterium]